MKILHEDIKIFAHILYNINPKEKNTSAKGNQKEKIHPSKKISVEINLFPRSPSPLFSERSKAVAPPLSFVNQ